MATWHPFPSCMQIIRTCVLLDILVYRTYYTHFNEGPQLEKNQFTLSTLFRDFIDNTLHNIPVSDSKCK